MPVKRHGLQHFTTVCERVYVALKWKRLELACDFTRLSPQISFV